ncbi:MAG: NUDIX domain-containing protein, partial [Thermonemataceae bacterium]
MDQQEEILARFGNQLRVRVCGICVQDNQLLLVKHQGLQQGYLWAPPGGGMQFGESAETCLVREFEEETGLQIAVEQFLFVHEFLRPPLHGIELFFTVTVKQGTLRIGYDP